MNDVKRVSTPGKIGHLTAGELAYARKYQIVPLPPRHDRKNPAAARRTNPQTTPPQNAATVENFFASLAGTPVPPPSLLSPRQAQVAAAVARGLSNKAVAAEVGITPGSAKVYLVRIFRRLNVGSRMELARLYWERERAAIAPTSPAA